MAQHLLFVKNLRFWRIFAKIPENNWSTLASKFAFAHNTSLNYTTGLTPNGILLGIKPQILINLKLGQVRDKNKQCKSEFFADLSSHTHSENKFVP